MQRLARIQREMSRSNAEIQIECICYFATTTTVSSIDKIGGVNSLQIEGAVFIE
jgi:hypothetical protein